MITDLRKTPFPYFGGSADAAPSVWDALGDCDHYVEPFAGSLAVLMRRPHPCNRTYYSETVNDKDGLLVNAWRGMQMHQDATADAASWPVSEADMHARHLAILKWKRERAVERLMGDPFYCDPVIAGWWIWGMSCWIGSGWCSGRGPWVVGDDGRITKRAKGDISRKLPHLTSTGRGANHAGTREPGVSRQLPHLGSDGQGANRPQLREPGVSRKLPHLGGNGQGANRPQLREPGVSRQLPHLGNDGRGANRPQLREPGVATEDDDGREFHPMTMPELRRWFQFLSARLRHVRILNGDWRRAVTGGAAFTLPVRQGGVCGVFVDPPYADSADRDPNLYTEDCGNVAHEAREWAIEAGSDKRFRIVFKGFDGEHGTALTDAGWREVEWFKSGWLKGGMAQQGAEGHQQERERLWLSPHCLAPSLVAPPAQLDMFGNAPAPVVSAQLGLVLP